METRAMVCEFSLDVLFNFDREQCSEDAGAFAWGTQELEWGDFMNGLSFDSNPPNLTSQNPVNHRLVQEEVHVLLSGYF